MGGSSRPAGIISRVRPTARSLQPRTTRHQSSTDETHEEGLVGLSVGLPFKSTHTSPHYGFISSQVIFVHGIFNIF